MQASRPSEGRAVLGTPLPTKCPRCSSPVAGDYKFCPVCAYRLRIDPGDPPPVPPPSAWKRGFLIASALAVGLALVLLGVILFRPDWIQPHRPSAPAPIGYVRPESYLNPVIGVDDIPGLLRELRPDEVVRYHRYFSLTEEDRERLNDLFDPGERQAERLFKDELIPVKIDYALQASAYEVTNHQYAQFIRDVEANPDHIPEYWRQDPATMKDFSVLQHVPRGWLVSDAGGESTGWHLADDARNLPVADVTQGDANGFAQWASARFKLAGAASLRLPALDEWTRAARGHAVVKSEADLTETREWPWGSSQLIYACNNSTFWQKIGRPEYVHFEFTEGGHGATNEGLLAMAGNVYEFALDTDVELVIGTTVDTTYVKWRYKTVSPTIVHACGGSFRAGIDDCQVTSKILLGARDRRDDVGFRLFSSAPPK